MNRRLVCSFVLDSTSSPPQPRLTACAVRCRADAVGVHACHHVTQ